MRPALAPLKIMAWIHKRPRTPFTMEQLREAEPMDVKTAKRTLTRLIALGYLVRLPNVLGRTRWCTTKKWSGREITLEYSKVMKDYELTEMIEKGLKSVRRKRG